MHRVLVSAVCLRSTSPEDRVIVTQFETYAKALGDDFLSRCTHLRTGEVWSDRIEHMIRESDVFQLFWSSNSMYSPFAKSEWEHALSLSRPNFVRPVYWEEPRPGDPEKNLPPEELRRLHFQKIGAVHKPVARQALRFDSLPDHPSAVEVAGDVQDRNLAQLIDNAVRDLNPEQIDDKTKTELNTLVNFFCPPSQPDEQQQQNETGANDDGPRDLMPTIEFGASLSNYRYIRIEEQKGVPVIVLRSQVLVADRLVADIEREMIDFVGSCAASSVVVDLSEVHCVGSNFIGSLLSVRRRLRDRGTQLKFRGVRPEIADVLCTTGPTDLFQVETLATAEGAPRWRSAPSIATHKAIPRQRTAWWWLWAVVLVGALTAVIAQLCFGKI